MKRSEILKIYGTEYRENTIRLLEEADLISLIPNRNCRIAVKPNLVSPSPASFGATTHTEVVSGIIEYLQSHGCTSITLMEGSWVGDRTQDAVETCGYDTLCRKYHVPFIDTQKEPAVSRSCKGMELKICRCVQDVDFLINVPVMKGHCQTKVTCALKNLKGLIPNQEKRHFHAMGLHKPIAYLNAAIRQDFIVVDHICGDLDFEDGGNPVVRNCIMAARDPVLTDSYAAYLMGYDKTEIPYLQLAEDLGIGTTDLEKAEVRILGGGEQEKPLPKSGKVVELSDAVYEVESCSACYGYLLPALDRLKQEGLLEPLMKILGESDTRLCIGQGFRGKNGKLGIGSCTSGFDWSVKGCPPTETEIFLKLKELIQSSGHPECGSAVRNC